MVLHKKCQPEGNDHSGKMGHEKRENAPSGERSLEQSQQLTINLNVS